MVPNIGKAAALIETKVAENQFNSMDSIALITKQIVERARTERSKQAVDFDRGDFIRATQKIKKMVTFKEKVVDKFSATTKAATAIKSIKDILTTAKSQLQNILGSNSGLDRENLVKNFDKHIMEIRNRVESANQQIGFQTINLVGNPVGEDWETDNIYTATGVSGKGLLTIEGAYLGTDFHVTDESGLKWRLDNTDNTFYQYKSDGSGEKTGNYLAANGLRVENYNSTTGAVTYGGSGSLSGTLQRFGIQMLNSEYHNNLANDAAVETAISDIDRALNVVSLKGNPIIAGASLFQSRMKSINLRIEILEDEKDQIRQEELSASSAKNLAAELKFQMTLNNMNFLTQANNGLIENMLNLTKGPSRAPGLLGLMGY